MISLKIRRVDGRTKEHWQRLGITAGLLVIREQSGTMGRSLADHFSLADFPLLICGVSFRLLPCDRPLVQNAR
jgi:hypothetical protein